jgi:predicted nuclease of predicted toxin-antitoxin system
MKLLFDQNLSPRLTRLLDDLYPGSLHVREVGLREAEDAAIWEYAKQNGFIAISKDSDFQARSLLFGIPP